MKALLAVVLLCAPLAQADTVTQVAAYLDKNSAIPLQGDVGDDLAENLLAAQAANPGLNSLLLSENAVLKAITFYEGQDKRITDTDAPIVFAQSNIAIDPNAGVGLSPNALYFGTVATPEPATWALLLAGLLWVFAFTRKPKQREYPGNHPYRK
jgi:hypothetical protein